MKKILILIIIILSGISVYSQINGLQVNSYKVRARHYLQADSTFIFKTDTIWAMTEGDTLLTKEALTTSFNISSFYLSNDTIYLVQDVTTYEVALRDLLDSIHTINHGSDTLYYQNDTIYLDIYEKEFSFELTVDTSQVDSLCYYLGAKTDTTDAITWPDTTSIIQTQYQALSLVIDSIYYGTDDTLRVVQNSIEYVAEIKGGSDSTRFDITDGYLRSYLSGVTDDSTGFDGRYRLISDTIMNGEIGRTEILSTSVSISYSMEFDSTDYFDYIYAYQYDTIDGDIYEIQKSIFNKVKSTTGVSFEVEESGGWVDYFVVDSAGVNLAAGYTEVDPIWEAEKDTLQYYVPFDGADRDVTLGANSLSTDSLKIGANHVKLAPLTSGSLGAAGTHFIGAGTTAAGTWKTTNEAIGNNALTATYFTYWNASGYLSNSGAIWDGSSLVNSKLIGGTATTSDLYLQTTSGVGTTGADMHFLVGNNGATEAMTILNNGNVGIGMTNPAAKLDVVGNINIDPASAYLFDGNNALKLSKNGEAVYYSTLVGMSAGNSASALSIKQTALGYESGYSNTGANQTAVGYASGQANTGAYQTAVGYRAGQANTGANQTAVGLNAGHQNTGAYQTAVGLNAGHQNTGANQTAVGMYAGYQNTGANQTAVGYASGYQNTGANQTAVGFASGHQNAGDRVIGIGYEATRGNTATADDVVAIGYQAGLNNTVANQFIVKQANINAVPLIQGDFSTGNVGIGTTAPDKALEVNSATGANLRLTYNDADGSAANYVDYSVDSGGDGTINSSGDTLNITDVVNITKNVHVTGSVNVSEYVKKAKSKHVYGGFQDSTVVVDCTDDTWVMITNTAHDLWGGDEADGFSLVNDTMIVTETADYSGTLSMSFAGGNGNDYFFRIYNVTQAAQAGYKLEHTTGGAATYENITIPLYIEATAGDSLVFQVMNTTNGDDLTVHSAIFILTYLHD